MVTVETGVWPPSRGGFGPELRPVISSERIFKVDTWMSVSGPVGEPGVGFRRASRMFSMPARIKSFEDVIGIVTLVGNHEGVSQVCSKECVSQI